MRAPRTAAGGRISANPGVWSTAIIAVNILFFLLVEATGGTTRSALFQDAAMVADTVYNPTTGRLIDGFLDGAWWRPVTGAFMHAGLVHLLLNMLAIVIFGRLVEQWLGSTRFVAVYVLSILGSALAVLWFSPGNQLTVGASGAVFGLFAVALVMQIRRREDVRFLVALLVINIGFSFTEGISWQAHLGGFVTGAVIGAVFAFTPRSIRTPVHVVATVGLGAGLAGLLYLPVLA